MENFIELEHVYKSFGKVHANKDICLQVRKGEILALLGENGSGKSTMVNIMAGIYSPDSGVIRVKNKVTEFHSPDDAIKNGIGMVHQHFKLVNVFSAMENIILGQKENFFIHKKDARNKILELEKKYSFSIDPDKKIYSMSVSEKQTVEILKMLYQGAELLILDEPTAVLTPQETQKLFAVLRKMKETGCSVIIITHKLNEVMEISDRVAVLRKGSYAGTVITKETNAKELADLMVGSETNLEAQWFEAKKSPKPLLSLSNVTILDQNNMKKVDSMSLEVFGGEILGVAGIVGSGQKEICEAISGLQKIESGEIYFEDRSLVSLSPRAIKKLGVRMSFIPEDRLGMGLVAGMDITENVLLKNYDESDGLFVDREAGRRRAELIVKNYDVSTPGINHVVRKLSGGNIQKVLLGREIEMHPKVLITAYPFRGLDVGASKTIFDMLNEQKQHGVAILLVAEDLDILRGLSDRLLVIHNGRNMGVVDPRNTSKEKIGVMMMGGEQ